MAFTRVTALWSGATGLPGYSRFKFEGALDSAGALAAVTRVRTFFEAFKGIVPTAVNITYTEAAQIYNSGGELQGEVSYSPPLPTQGTGSGAFSAPSGMVVNWLTNTVSNGRKVRGRTFLVPLAGSAFGGNGQPLAGSASSIAQAAQALLAGSPPLIVFSPSRVLEVGGITLQAGQAPVTGVSVPTRAAILRSRRD